MNENCIRLNFKPKETGGLVPITTDVGLIPKEEDESLGKAGYCSQKGANSFRKTKTRNKKYITLG